MRGLAYLLLVGCCALYGAQTPSSTLSVNQNTISFGDHDIGTPTARSLTATNDGNVPVDLMTGISGDAAGDFSWSSTCLSRVLPKTSCQIAVVFKPAAIGKDKGEGEDRKATLGVTDNKGETKDIELAGKAFQNVNISPTSLDFETQIDAASSVARNAQLTNYTSSAINSITVTVSGDFTENHSGCSMPLAPGDSCGILVTFSPKQAGGTSGSLRITANLSDLGNLSRSVSLNGLGLNQCKINRFSFRSLSSWLVLIISGLYFLGLVLVRWHLIAKPARAQLVAEIEAVRSRAVAETAGRPDSPELNERLARIHFLLDQAIYPFKYRNFPINPLAQGRRAKSNVPSNLRPYFTRSTRFFNALFWTRGHELAGWSLAHEAELQLVALLRLETVQARLEAAEDQLREMKTTPASALADRIHKSLICGEELVVEQARQLLQQFQQLVERTSAPSAARRAWLADLQQRLLNSLQKFSSWAQKNTAAPATVAECLSRLQEFSKIAAPPPRLNDDLSKVGDPANLPSQLGPLLKDVTDFFARVIDAIKKMPAADDQTVTLDGCNKSLSILLALGTEAEGLSTKLNLAPVDQAKAYEELLDLCKSQGSLVELITQANTANPASALLLDLLAAAQDQDQLIRKINQEAADGRAADFGNCRDLVFQLANLPPLPRDLIGRINCLLVGEAPASLTRWKAILVEALGLIYENADNDFSQLASWHNKMMWLVGCALLFMFALAVTVGNAILLLLGAVGGLLSRLTRTTAAADVPSDYGATWGSLFLSPLTGALSAWGGILLIMLGLKLNILGSALKLDWCNPYEPVALAIALLFGFSERLFDSVTDQLQDKLLKSPPSSSSPAPSTTTPTPAAPAPKINSVSPTSAIVGKEVQLAVRGASFQRGATASLTKDTGDPLPAKLDFTDSTSVVVTCTPSGAKAFTATLTITNPDKQVATAKLNVGASS